MEQKIWKSAFHKLELKEETKEKVWEQIVQKSAVKGKAAEGIYQKKGGRQRRHSFGRWAAAVVVCSVLLGIVLINFQTEGKFMRAVQKMWKVEKTSQEIVDQTVSYQFDSLDAPKLIDCNEERLIFACTMGLIVYDREQKRVVGTIDLKEIECFYIEDCGDEKSVITRFLSEGNRLTIYNHKAGKKIQDSCYIYNLAECRSLEKGEVKALEPEKKAPVTNSLEERWKRVAKTSQKKTFDNKIYSHFRQELKKSAENGGIIFTSQTISWCGENGEKYYSCLAYTALADNAGQGKKECSYILYSKNRDTGEMEKESLALKANMPDVEEETLPAYECRVEEPVRKALADCAGENFSRYRGRFYGVNKRYAMDENYSDNIPILPIINIYGLKEGKKYTKVYGVFDALGLARSGNILYEVDYYDTLGYGCAYLKKTADGYTVEKILHPRDGAYYMKDVLAMCDGDEKLFKKIWKQMNSRWKTYQKEVREMVQEYVTVNGLDVKYFKENGENLVKLDKE